MRIEQLTFTRFLAAILIVVFHFGNGVFPFNLPGLTTLISFGYIGVSYFFVLSGFVMIVAYGREQSGISFKNYYLNRLAKIYPVYITALILALLVTKPQVEATKLGSETLLIQSFLPRFLPSYNLPDWSLSVELLFYLLYPLLLNLFFLKNRIFKIGVFIVGFWMLSQIINYLLGLHNNGTEIYHNFIYYHPFVHLNEFLAGNFTGLVFLRFLQSEYLRSDKPLLALMLVFILGIAWLRWMQLHGFNWAVNFHNGLLVLFFAPLILFLSLNRGFFAKIFNHSLLVFLGEISYCIYILQLPLYTLFNNWFKLNNPLTALYFYIVFLIACSSIVYLYIEIPGKRLVRKYLKNA
ncbi:acyltransferase [Mucilaginibacter achroorhodeus]|uniref:Acyltransferase n=1 Tax=Mucilaginibacter achroorhodeus TaxID=2599294 RepID=A0A563TZ74_9SPHI|nr:acyltransferase [Mucilaginibacter achroorhodeus]